MAIAPLPDLQRRRANTWLLFGGLVLVLGVFLLAVFVAHFSVRTAAETLQQEANEVLNVELGRRALVEDLAAVTTDLMFLLRLVEPWEDRQLQDASVRRELTRTFMDFAREKGMYDQVRLLDVSGTEVIRINLNDGQPMAVSPDGLQDKSNRYYVKHGLGLQRGQLYLSPLDLNIEGGEIERPLKPVLRFATPVITAQGELRGLLVLNFLGQRLLDRFQRAAANISGHVHLLNGDGHWLSSPAPHQAWGFMFGRNVTFAGQQSDAWPRISGAPEGQFTTEDGLFTFATVLPASMAASHLNSGQISGAVGQVWKVVAYLQHRDQLERLVAFARQHAGLYLGVLVIVAILAYLYANTHIRHQATEAQRRYEQQFRQILENMSLVALTTDMEGRITFCNHYLLELTGWREDELRGQEWISCLTPATHREHLRELGLLFRSDGEYPTRIESPIVTRMGEQRLIAWHNTRNFDADGQVVGLTGIGEDVTERRLAEDQVKQLSRAVEQSPASVVITNLRGEIEYVNPKFESVTGYRREEVVGQNPRLLKSGETPSREYGALWKAIETGGEWRGEFHNRRKDGSLYWEAAVISALRDSRGRHTHYLAVKEDITDRKRLQDEVDERNRELARAQALAAMGRMATMLAHDLSNPLSSVKMAVQILGKEPTLAEARELADIGLEQVHYMEDIISEMLTYARPSELEVTWLDAGKLLTGVSGTVQRRVVEHGADLSVENTPGLPTFPGDASKLRQLLSNLLANSLQAVSERPVGDRHVTISTALKTRPDGNWIVFRVCDNGGGIAPEALEHIFEPFFTTRSKGTGLGLAIVRQITDLHGGDIQFTSNGGQGTCAELTLPLTPPDKGGNRS